MLPGRPVRQSYSYSVPSPHGFFKNSSSGGPVRKPYSYSVPSPHRLFKKSSSALTHAHYWILASPAHYNFGFFIGDYTRPQSTGRGGGAISLSEGKIVKSEGFLSSEGRQDSYCNECLFKAALLFLKKLQKLSTIKHLLVQIFMYIFCR
jgi:hypothetical protein